MNYRQRFRYNMFVRVRQFGVENTAQFPVGSVGAAQFAALTTVINQLDTYTAEQAAGFNDARFAFANKDIAREKLHNNVSAISRTARSMVYEFPGIDVKFRMPRRTTDQHLLSAARAFYDELDVIDTDFQMYGMTPSFRGDLNTAITAFEATLAPTSAAIDEQVEATADINETVKRGMVAVRILNGVVRNIFRNDVGKLAAWTSASHIEKAPKSEKPAPPIFQEDEILI